MLLSRLKQLSALSLLSITALAVTPAQALDIKQEQINGCVKTAAAYKMADKSTATKLCSCTVDVRSKMTLGQMWEIESYARSNKDPSKLPYAIKMQKDLKQCAKGLTLNPPQKPS